MPTAVFVLGLCGSGKSHVAREREARGFLNCGEGVAPRQECPKWFELLDDLRAGKDCVVTEIADYSAHEREILRQHLDGIQGVLVEWVCFENDRATADENCRKDYVAGKRTKQQYEDNVAQNARTIALFGTGDLTFPEGVPLTKVYSL